MMRFFMIIVACVSTTVVVSETTALFLMWQRGMISGHHLREIKLVLTNRNLDDEADSLADQKPEFPSPQQSTQTRTVKVLNLDKRDDREQVVYIEIVAKKNGRSQE